MSFSLKSCLIAPCTPNSACSPVSNRATRESRVFVISLLATYNGSLIRPPDQVSEVRQLHSRCIAPQAVRDIFGTADQTSRDRTSRIASRVCFRSLARERMMRIGQDACISAERRQQPFDAPAGPRDAK